MGIELNTCLKCGCEIKNDNMYFSSNRGGVVCKNCSDISAGYVLMHSKIRDFLKELEITDFFDHSSYEEKATEKICTVCFELLKGYINLHSPRRFNSTEILQEIS